MRLKELTTEEFKNLPVLMLHLYVSAAIKWPVSTTMSEEALEKYPEYYPEEVEYRRKWALVPQHVHDEYLKEMAILKDKIYKDLPPSKGILGWANDPKGYKEFSDKWNECMMIELPFAKELHSKFYAEYGIEWRGN